MKPAHYAELTRLLVDLSYAPLSEDENDLIELLSALVERDRSKVRVTPAQWARLRRMECEYYP